MRLTPGNWVRLRSDENYAGPWETVGVVEDIDISRMEACVRFADGNTRWVPIFDLMLLPR